MREEAIELINLLLNKLTYHRIVVDSEIIDRIQNFIYNSKEQEQC